MAPSTPPTKAAEPRPGPLRSSRSFPRHGTQEVIDPLTRSQRANTIQNDGTPEIIVQQTSPQKNGTGSGAHDAFETDDADDSVEPPRASVDLDDIPIELVSLTDNFIDSLLAKVHPTPPNIDNLSGRFQDFYHAAAPHIQTHIETLALRQKRSNAVRPITSSRPSAASLLRAKAASLATKEKAKPTPQESEQQMLTAEELANRKRERKALDQKRALLEEAVERRLCEGMYDRIYRHRTTQDEAVDDKLRSKTAAFTMLGIGPANLGIDLSERGGKEPESAAKKQEDIRESLEQARRDLILMHEKRYPLGKLNHLKNAHKSIVETLSQFHPSASADEIMPMLIYTLITLPADKLNVASDCNFIQRFRWEEKLSGETAYCLTNLEAAINFLETVDLASLHAEESLTGPPGRLESVPGTPGADSTFPPAYSTSASSLDAPSGTTTATDAPRRPPSPATAARTMAQRRRLSDLIQTPAQAIGNARDSFFDTADQGFKNISNSLGDSYNFLMGKLRDTSVTGNELVVPRTLDDARKLIGTPPIEDDASLDGIGSVPGTGADKSQSRDDKVLNLIGGRKAPRDRSADSARSAHSAGSSSKKVVFADDGKEKTPAAAAATPSASNPALVDQMRNLGNSLNPMNRLASMSMMRGFGRTTPTPTPSAKETAAGPAKSTDGGDLATVFPDIAAALPPKQDAPQIKPPNKRFMDLQNPADLKLGEVLELLRDYRRLAGALKERDAFRES